MPELHAPFPCVDPSENIVWPVSPASMRVMGLSAIAFNSPEIVTTELSEASTSVSVTSVTVIVFAPSVRGLL